MAVEDWSRTAGDNNDPTKEGMKERMDRSDVNDQSRGQLAALRTFFEDGEWLDLLKENNGDFTVARSGVLMFDVTDAGGTNATSKFPIGRWVKITGTGTWTVVYGEVSSVSAYASSKITVTVKNTVDASYADTSDIPTSTVTKVECYWNSRIREAAFHPVGTTISQAPTELLAVDDLSSAAVVTELNKATGLDADTVDNLHASAFQLAAAAAGERVLNGSFLIWQRGTSFTTPADGSYVADGWVMLAESANWDVSQDTTTRPTGFSNSMKLTANGTGTSKVGVLHIIEAADTLPIVDNGKCSLTYQVRLPASIGLNDVRVGILEWSGTADNATKDCVSVWNTEGTDPTLATSWAYANTPSASKHTSNDNTWTTITVENVTIAGSTKNIGIFIWSEDKTFTSGDFFYIGAVKLQEGATATAAFQPQFGLELQRCMRRFEKTYTYNVAPGSATAPNSQLVNQGNMHGSVASNQGIVIWTFKVGKLENGTLAVTVYSPDTGATGQCNLEGSGDLTATSNNPGTCAVELQCTGNPGTTGRLRFHATVSAEPTT